MDVRPFFVPTHNVDIDEAKFKIGENVIYRYFDKELEDHIRLETVVLAVNFMHEDDEGPVFEYAIEDHIYLIYESELEKKKNSEGE